MNECREEGLVLTLLSHTLPRRVLSAFLFYVWWVEGPKNLQIKAEPLGVLSPLSRSWMARCRKRFYFSSMTPEES